MKILILCLLSLTAFGQAISPIKDALLVNPYYGKLAEVKPNTEYSITFAKKEVWREIVFHLSAVDTLSEYELLFTLKKKSGTTPGPVLKEVIDNTAITYSPASTVTNPAPEILTTWNHFNGNVAPNPTWLNTFVLKTGSFSKITGSTAVIKFTGNKIELLGEKTNNKGKATFKIDNGPESPEEDLYAATGTNNSQVIFEASGLPDGQHTLTVKVAGTKNPASSGFYVLIDGARIYD